jgi:hypothetical protein
MQLYASMTPTGHQYPGPESGPRGAAIVNINTTSGVIDSNIQFADIAGVGRLYVVAGGKIIVSRNLPPPTSGVITDTWAAPPQVVQSIVANPSNAIVYVQAPPGNPGSPQSLPGGVVLNPGSIWARLQAAPSGGEANM